MILRQWLIIWLSGSTVSAWPYSGRTAHKAPPAAPETSNLLSSREDAIKVMVVGDSISQGHEGDWTWRYRLWQWFKHENITVDFVGPYKGTQPWFFPPGAIIPPVDGEDDPPPAWGQYAVGVSRDFDSSHFAAWGRPALFAELLVGYQVKKFKPDYLLVLLGFNDLGWFSAGPDDLIGTMKRLVDNARAANPNIKIALGNVVQRAAIGGREDLPINTDGYNKLLPSAIANWSTTASPIELVRVRENYDCGLTTCPAGHDGLHPNSLGDYQIAQAFSRTLLNDFKLGQRELAVPETFTLTHQPLSFRILVSITDKMCSLVSFCTSM